MRILLATDGSSCSAAALNELASRPWPPHTDVKIISVAHLQFPCLLPPVLVKEAIGDELLQVQQKLAAEHVGLGAFSIRRTQGNRSSAKQRQGNEGVATCQPWRNSGAEAWLRRFACARKCRHP